VDLVEDEAGVVAQLTVLDEELVHVNDSSEFQENKPLKKLK